MTKTEAKSAELKKKFRGLESRLTGVFLERTEVTQGMLLASLAGEHVLLLGPPGTAKSAIADQFCKAIDGATFFEWLLSKFTAPEELFGPISLESLKRDAYKRITRGKLPEAHVCFLDEIFKGSSAILNTLLTAINERKFHNEGGAKQIPLRMVIGASNELPEGPELGALYDRFLLRYWVQPVVAPDAFVALVTNPEPAVSSSLTLDDWDAARAAVASLPMPEDSARTLYKLRQALVKDGITASDRRWRRAVGLARACAWMSDETAVYDDHFGVLSHVLWSEPEQQSKVQEHVAQVTESVAIEASRVLEAIRKVVGSLPTAPKDAKEKDEFQQRVVSVMREANRADGTLKALKKKARNKRQEEQIEKAISELSALTGPIKLEAKTALGL